MKYKIIIDKDLKPHAYSWSKNTPDATVIRFPIYAQSKEEAIKRFTEKYTLLPRVDGTGFALIDNKTELEGIKNILIKNPDIVTHLNWMERKNDQP